MFVCLSVCMCLYVFVCVYVSVSICLFVCCRHDYVAHPRNPSGFVSRKIRNEAQLLRVVQKRYPTYRVKGVQIDLLDMRQQLNYIVNTDVLIGMHGAGLTHALFLPRRSALIELAPYYWTSHSEHFMAIAEWRSLVYDSWYNNDPTLEAANHTTNIPTHILTNLINKVVRRLCAPPPPPPPSRSNNVSSVDEHNSNEPNIYSLLIYINTT